MRNLLVLFRKDFLNFWRDRAAVVITFLVPIVLIYIFGYVFGLNKSGDSGPMGIDLAVVNLSTDPAAGVLVKALEAEKTFHVITTTKGADGLPRALTETDVRDAIRNNAYRFALIIPKDLIPDTGFGIHLKFLSNPRNEIESQTVNGVLQKTIFTNVPSLLGRSLQESARRFVGAARLDSFNRSLAATIADTFGGDRARILKNIESGGFGYADATKPENDAGLRRLDTPSAAAPAAKAAPDRARDVLGRIIRIDSEQVVGRQVKNPMASRLVGGYAIMFLLFAASGSSTSLFEEKKAGLFLRLLSGPVTRGQILGAKFLFGVVLGLIQLSVLFLAGHLLYDLELWRHLIPLLVVSLFASAACSAFGMAIAAVSRTQGAAQGLTTFLVLTMSAIGGAWFPVSFMPAFIQRISHFTVVYWSVEGFTDVLWAGQSLAGVLPTLGALALMAALILGFALWRFNRGRIFD